MTPRTTCDECGAVIVGNAEFCTNCGFYLGWNDKPAVERPAPTAQVHRTTAAEPAAARRLLPPPPGAGPAGFGAGVSAPREPAPDVGSTLARRCRRCRTENDESRRFCMKCGLYIGTPTSQPDLDVVPVPASFWQRLRQGRPGSERAALRSYRRSLPLLVRFRRAALAVLVLVTAFGFLRFAGRDPLTWVRHGLDDLRGTLVAVDDVTATSTSDAGQDFVASNAVDGTSNAWATPFSGPTAPTGGPCSTAPVLTLTTPHEIDLRAIKVDGGLSGDDRHLAWVPTVLDLRFSDGSCQRIQLDGHDAPQTVELHRNRTSTVGVSIVAGGPPQTGGSNLVAISEIALLVRPD